jgi:energy-coupling factor transporter transmembrane protein EcfT
VLVIALLLLILILVVVVVVVVIVVVVVVVVVVLVRVLAQVIALLLLLLSLLLFLFLLSLLVLWICGSVRCLSSSPLPCALAARLAAAHACASVHRRSDFSPGLNKSYIYKNIILYNNNNARLATDHRLPAARPPANIEHYDRLVAWTAHGSAPRLDKRDHLSYVPSCEVMADVVLL